jgi:transcriptional repressor NrdR
VKLQVEKKDGTIEPYSREKVIKGIKLATEKCGINDTQITALTDSLEQELIKSDRLPIPTSKIGKGILKRLQSIDEVAYLRFSSVYKSFSSIKSFEKELARLEKIK